MEGSKTQTANIVNSSAGNSKSKEAGGKLWGLTQNPNSRLKEPEICGQKRRARNQRAHETGHARARQDGWRLASQSGKKFSGLNTLFYHFFSFSFIFTLSPHPVRLVGNSILVLPGASPCTQGYAKTPVCYSACRALQSPELLFQWHRDSGYRISSPYVSQVFPSSTCYILWCF